ncbi:MAG: 4Fe-4S binding protein [Desulfamplus sp.]|nr:4Fe-4S binding protein [Desulfamplus sp.]
MIEHVKTIAKQLLESGQITGFLSLKKEHGQIGPHLFQSVDQLDYLCLGDTTGTENRESSTEERYSGTVESKPEIETNRASGKQENQSGAGKSRYPLNKILVRISRNYPSDCFGILVRGCDERGLKRLFALNQLDPDKVVRVGIACPQDLADECECLEPWPDKWVNDTEKTDGSEKEKIDGTEKSDKAPHEPVRQKLPCESVARLESLEARDRFDWWMEHFARCIKCYGCRDICPMCFCKECSLQDDNLVRTGEIPPEYPVFHLARAVHMAERCIDCGLCSEACPAAIPLRTLYKKAGDIMSNESGVRPGYSDLTPSDIGNLPQTGEY